MRSLYLTLATALLCALPLASPAQEAERIELEISEETTFFTEPVTEDGLIDYVAALNAHYGEGIANEDNAFVLLFQLFPAEDMDVEIEILAYWQNLYDYFDIEWDPDFPRFTDWIVYAKSCGIGEDRALEIHEEAINRPWTVEEFPLLADWIGVNARSFEVLALVLEGEQYFSPLIEVSTDESVLSVRLPHLGSIRQLGRYLLIRSFFALGRDDVASACDDFNLLYRFGCLVSREQTLIGKLVGVSIRTMQSDAIDYIVHCGLLNHDMAIRFLSCRSEAPEIRLMADALHYTERCMGLDMIQRSRVGQDPGWAYLVGDARVEGDAMRVIDWMAPLAQHHLFDVNRSLRDFNESYNELHQYSEIESAVERQEAFLNFENLKLESIERDEIVVIVGISQVDSPWIYVNSTWTTDRYTDDVTAAYARFLLPNFYPLIRSQGRSSTRRLVESTAIAILGYRDVHGELPESLEALVPTYFEAVPMDPYSEAPLVYRVNDDGSALVYSLGDNFEDNDGVDDYTDGDIAITIGAPPETSD